MSCHAQKSPWLRGCVLSPLCRSNPSKLTQLLTWNKARECRRKALPDITAVPLAREEGRQPASYSPHVAAFVRTEELRQKPKQKYHPVLLYRYGDLLSFGLTNAENNIPADAVIAELHKTNKLGCLQNAFKPRIPLNVGLNLFPAQQTDTCCVWSPDLQIFFIPKGLKTFASINVTKMTHQCIYEVIYSIFQHLYQIPSALKH